ncbi:MAG: DUF6491 family protein [Cellvibrionaceae bacterium]
MKKILWLPILINLTIFTLGCTSTAPTSNKLASTLEKMELTTGDSKDRILNYTIRSWKYVDSKHIILEARRKEFYLISLRTPCTGLSGALEIGFTSFGSSLSKFEKIIVQDSLNRNERCSIRDIVQLIPAESKSDTDSSSNDDE